MRQDLRLALRLLLKSPGFTALSVASQSYDLSGVGEPFRVEGARASSTLIFQHPKTLTLRIFGIPLAFS